MPETLNLNYYYGNEADQYSFYRIPKILLTDRRYKGVSLEAKVLYGLLLDRMGLSARNGWLDDNGRVFLYFTQEEASKTYFTGIMNAALGVLAILFIAVMLYIKHTILVPFERLSSLPYELSKGNLTASVTETKNRFFGKFLWGIDVLRENIEQQKQRELEMQKEKKMLLLSLSHDIKTPLSAIKLYSAALSTNLYPDAEKQQKVAESITEKADEIEGYVSQIITASREDFLSLEVNMGEFYLSELIEKITGYYREKLALIKTDFNVGKYKNCLLSGDLSTANLADTQIPESPATCPATSLPPACLTRGPWSQRTLTA